MKSDKYRSYMPYVYLVALLPAMLFRDYTPANELRYLSIADEALRDGHLFAFTNHGVIYADKPPLYIWIVMAGKYLLGRHYIWFLSLFSFVPALVIIRTMNKWVHECSDRLVGLNSEIVLMSCGMFLGMAIFVRMDMMMSMFVILSLYIFWQMLQGKISDGKGGVLFATYIFFAVFTKGPFGILIPLVSTVSYLIAIHRHHEIWRFWGLRVWMLLLAAFGLWFFLSWREGGASYLHNLLFHQTFGRAVNAFHHREPFYYYFVSYWYSLAPWSLLFAVVFVEARRQHVRLYDFEKFFLVVLLCIAVMLSLCSSKLAVYLLPAFPFIVYLAVSLMSRMRICRWMELSISLPAILFCLLPIAAFVIPPCRLVVLSSGVWSIVTLASLLVVGVVLLFVLYRQRKYMVSIRMLAFGMFLILFFSGMSLPSTNHYFGYGDLCRQASAVAKKNHTNTYYTWHISRSENMDVYLGKRVYEVSDKQLMSGCCRGGVVMLSERYLKKDMQLSRFLSHYRCYYCDGYVAVKCM